MLYIMYYFEVLPEGGDLKKKHTHKNSLFQRPLSQAHIYNPFLCMQIMLQEQTLHRSIRTQMNAG